MKNISESTKMPGKQSSWICPSDRLSAGWSVWSDTQRADKSTISDNEMQQIKDVIARAEHIEENEQRRIGSNLLHFVSNAMAKSSEIIIYINDFCSSLYETACFFEDNRSRACIFIYKLIKAALYVVRSAGDDA
ncbi:rabphilin-3A [Trichinella spiralis]|uniref:rabphilin-3A n=1 Tax=Trichinella spiralis TaxID=6334 RepID=UPI0001EFCE3A|nr:rabphilin-3A [Trichinella spiralis]